MQNPYQKTSESSIFCHCSLKVFYCHLLKAHQEAESIESSESSESSKLSTDEETERFGE
ncbi:hypothetical protein HPP92_025532 [Vanilla planifolia]|uniref:Uncharacterized protein n=1 Tax=Vanilla planifolia TaxID=51239 RepID=A0A835PK68_VANPL|nr:hypothetical protein HPP92_025532 [Vanilla planifolia]